MKAKVIATILSMAGVGLFASTPAVAHHSFAVYNMKKAIKVDGTVKVFRWGAPHSSLVLVTKDEKGKSLEMAIGNGKLGGVMSSMTLPDGKVWSSGEVASATDTSGGGQ